MTPLRCLRHLRGQLTFWSDAVCVSTRSPILSVPRCSVIKAENKLQSRLIQISFQKLYSSDSANKTLSTSVSQFKEEVSYNIVETGTLTKVSTILLGSQETCAICTQCTPCNVQSKGQPARVAKDKNYPGALLRK